MKVSVRSRRPLLAWLAGAGATAIVMAVAFGAFAYRATLARPYENRTIGDLLQNCDALRPRDPEGCGDLRLILESIIEKHVLMAVAASMLVSAALVGCT
jgi:hypothetical protein